jgi:hypothetical protein
MWVLWAIVIVAWNLVPYKAWSRSLFESEGFNLGDLVLLIALLPSVVFIFRNFKKDKLWLSIALLWGITGVSFAKGILYGEDLREMLRVIRAMLLWGTIPLMVHTIGRMDTFRRWGIGTAMLLVYASISIVVFSYDPSMIPLNDEVASVREVSYGGVERVFTSGMWGVFTGATVIFAMLVISQKAKVWPLILMGVLLIGLLHTFVRTYIILLLLAMFILAWKSWRVVVRSVFVPTVIVILLVFAIGIPDSFRMLATGTISRVSGIIEADFSELDPTDMEAYGTVFWRLAEVRAGAAQVQSPIDLLVGVMGRPYSLDDAYSTTVPHIGYFGIFYLNGLLGALCYFVSFSIMTIRLWKNSRLTIHSPLSWATRGAFVAWVCLLLGSITAPLFQFAYGVSCFAFVVGLSEVARQVAFSGSKENDLHAENNSRDSEFQFG